MILVDTAFGSIEFLAGIGKFKYHALAGVRYDRQLQDGRSLRQLHKRRQQVRLVGLKFPVTISCYYLKRERGKLEKRFVLSTKSLKGSTLTWWGQRRWQIEAWFKTAKHRFGLHRFGQATLKGIYRWLVLSLIAYLLAHWAYLSTAFPNLPDWREAAKLALEVFLPQLVVLLLLLEVRRLQPLLRTPDLEIQITRCKI